MYELVNKDGARKTAPEGFSFTVLFFGVFVPLYRGDLKIFFLYLLASFILGALGGELFVTILDVGMAMKYNEIYLDSLLEEGYTIVDQ